MNESSRTTDKQIVELATFYVGNSLCGMNILKVQEINKLMQMTKVPQAPDYVLGILNLRGQIVTIIDLGKKLGLGETDISSDPRNIIVNSAGGTCRTPGAADKRCRFGGYVKTGKGTGKYERHSGRIFYRSI